MADGRRVGSVTTQTSDAQTSPWPLDRVPRVAAEDRGRLRPCSSPLRIDSLSDCSTPRRQESTTAPAAWWVPCTSQTAARRWPRSSCPSREA